MKRALKYATTHIHIYNYIIIILNNFERNFRNVIFRIIENVEIAKILISYLGTKWPRSD